MKLMNWLTKHEDPALFDYSTLLIRVEKLQRMIHDACLEKKYDQVPAMADEIIEQCVLLKKWVRHQR